MLMFSVFVWVLLYTVTIFISNSYFIYIRSAREQCFIWLHAWNLSLISFIYVVGTRWWDILTYESYL